MGLYVRVSQAKYFMHKFIHKSKYKVKTHKHNLISSAQTNTTTTHNNFDKYLNFTQEYYTTWQIQSKNIGYQETEGLPLFNFYNE